MSIKALRTSLAGAIADGVPDVAVVPYGGDLGSIDRVTVVCATSNTLEPSVGCSYPRAIINVYVLVPLVDAEGAEDLLDDTLEAVLEAIRGLPRTLVRDGERLALSGSFPAFRIPVEVSP